MEWREHDSETVLRTGKKYILLDLDVVFGLLNSDKFMQFAIPGISLTFVAMRSIRMLGVNKGVSTTSQRE